MSDYDQTVTLTLAHEHVAVVTLNRPEAMNAVNAVLACQLEEITLQCESRRDIRVVVLTGAGRAFCAGADLKSVAAGGLQSLMRPESGFAGFVQFARTKPWIASVEGVALAGGFEIALACDLIVASSSAEFGLPEVSRGLIASGGGLYRLPRRLPSTVAKELILTATRLSCTRAAQLGLVNRVAASGRALEAAIALAVEISANAPVAVQESLGVVSRAIEHGEKALQRLSDEAQLRVMLTDDFAEGPRAFVEKRKPHWKGR